MVRRLAAAALALLLSAPGSSAQQPAGPIPLFPAPPPPGFELQPMPPFAPAPEPPRPPGPLLRDDPSPPGPVTPGSMTALAAETARVFCDQPVTVRIADRDSVPERYRNFVGIWSDAAWTPQFCAALVVEHVAPDGTARIVYAFGPLRPNPRAPGGVLHGTGIIRDGELRFQNSDGSQFAFRPLYSDLDGRLTTPQGQSYQAIFKKTL